MKGKREGITIEGVRKKATNEHPSAYIQGGRSNKKKYSQGPEPCDSHLRSGRTPAHEMPQPRTVVALVASPLREQREPVVERRVRRAGEVPREGWVRRRWASVSIVHHLSASVRQQNR